jgi:hypothetical protein
MYTYYIQYIVYYTKAQTFEGFVSPSWQLFDGRGQIVAKSLALCWPGPNRSQVAGRGQIDGVAFAGPIRWHCWLAGAQSLDGA